MKIHEALAAADSKKARVEIIPLIDVIFFLLATFVLFTLTLNKIQSLDLNLPKGISSGEGSETMLYLQATEAGAYYWKIGDRAVPALITTAELLPRLADFRARSELPKVFIRGDNRATFGATIYAFDSVRLAGIPDVSIETKPSPTGH